MSGSIDTSETSDISDNVWDKMGWPFNDKLSTGALLFLDGSDGGPITLIIYHIPTIDDMSIFKKIVSDLRNYSKLSYPHLNVPGVFDNVLILAGWAMFPSAGGQYKIAW